jgi:hypothetical protein
LFVDQDYSFLLQDKKSQQVLYTAYSRDTPLIYETELRTFTDNDIIVPSLVHLDAVLDTTLGDALFTLDPGKFEGQQVHLIADGTGIAELIGGNGIYVNSIFITENTGGAHLKWTNSKWVAVNEVTADYVDMTQRLKIYANGGLVIIGDAGKSSNSAWIGNFSKVFLSTPSLIPSIRTDVASYVRYTSATTNTSFTIVASLSDASNFFSFIGEGKY